MCGDAGAELWADEMVRWRYHEAGSAGPKHGNAGRSLGQPRKLWQRCCSNRVEIFRLGTVAIRADAVGRGQCALTLRPSFMPSLQDAVHELHQPQKRDIPNQLTMGTFLPSFDIAK